MNSCSVKTQDPLLQFLQVLAVNYSPSLLLFLRWENMLPLSCAPASLFVLIAHCLSLPRSHTVKYTVSAAFTASVTAGCFHVVSFMTVAIAGKVLNLLETPEHAQYGWGIFLVLCCPILNKSVLTRCYGDTQGFKS